MTIEFTCDGCGRRLTVPAAYAGKKASCPECRSVVAVPALSVVAAAVDSDELQAVEATEQPLPDRPLDPPSGQLQVVGSLAAEVCATPPVIPIPAPAEHGWFLRTPEGKSYGPVSRMELEEWIRQGRVTSDCDLRTEIEIMWQPADQVFPALSSWKRPLTPVYHRPAELSRSLPVPADHAGPQRSSAEGETEPILGSTGPAFAPDRGILILSLGIVGVFAPCPIFSVMAWVMGTADIYEIRAGRMDPRGLTSTQWGRILGIIVTIGWMLIAVVGTVWCLMLAAS